MQLIARIDATNFIDYDILFVARIAFFRVVNAIRIEACHPANFHKVRRVKFNLQCFKFFHHFTSIPFTSNHRFSAFVVRFCLPPVILVIVKVSQVSTSPIDSRISASVGAG